MKFQVMLRILFRLLKSRKVSAAALAKENDVSERSIRRYLEELIVCGVPLDIIRGRGGGICLPDTYRLPENFLTREELTAAINALGALSEQLPSEAVRSAMEKLQMHSKTGSRDLSLSGNILVDSGTWGDAYGFSDKLRVLEEATEKCACLEIQYIDRSGKESRRIIEPHLLVYKQNIWYVYAWCRTRQDFRLFRVGRMRSARDTGEVFEKRAFDKEHLPLQFHFENTQLAEIRLLVTQKALPDVEEWLGMDNVREEKEGLIATATVPAGEVLLSRLLSFGDGIRVLAPDSLAEQLKERTKNISSLYV